jgi:hypothetical protein
VAFRSRLEKMTYSPADMALYSVEDQMTTTRPPRECMTTEMARDVGVGGRERKVTRSST